MIPWDRGATDAVLTDVRLERFRQHEVHGQQDHEDGTGGAGTMATLTAAKRAADHATEEGRLTYSQILAEEVAEALAESDPMLLRAELVQVAAVAVQWVEAIDRRLRR